MIGFLKETVVYAARIRTFTMWDWLSYIAWVGLMTGLLLATTTFVLFGYLNHVDLPGYAWNVPVGTFIFVVAIAFDTIGHRTIYKEEIKKGELLVHHITIFAGVTSCLLLCLAYSFPDGLKIPALTMVVLSIFYSVIDEALHWRRYIMGHSDPVEMWSHFFIFTGHLMMILSWWLWYMDGYPGVSEILNLLD